MPESPESNDRKQRFPFSDGIRRFGPLFATQFLGAFNDNVFKTALFVMIGFYGLGQNGVLPAG
ncbi:hypothetical protein LUZ88_08240, partial [Neisseria gonorrhoeae]|nr:hypothetical protein [Neisseria gonorrhoeae]